MPPGENLFRQEGPEVPAPKPEHQLESREATIARVGEILKEGIDALVIHGTTIRRDGKETFVLRPDLDAMGGLYLMDIAGINYSMATSVPKGEKIPGKVHIDTGGYGDTTIVQEDNEEESVFFDHHAEVKGEQTSATKLVYEALVENKLLTPEPWMEQFVEFVTECDNLSYKVTPNHFKSTWAHSMYGQNRSLSAEQVANLFKSGHNPKSAFTQHQRQTIQVLENRRRVMNLEEACAKRQKEVDRSVKGMDVSMKKMMANHLKIETPELGKIMINEIHREGKKTIDEIPLGGRAANAMGYDTYIMTDGSGFFISSQTHDLEPIFEKIQKELPEAKLVRGTMILYKSETHPVATRRLLEILNLFEDGAEHDPAVTS
ncbi:MAG TPA: hypothetical protein VI981_01210 [Candidatus Paceibacterota bacterium]